MFVGEREVCMHTCVCFQPLWVKKIEGAIIRKAVCLRHALGRVEGECMSSSRSQKCKVGRGALNKGGLSPTLE